MKSCRPIARTSGPRSNCRSQLTGGICPGDVGWRHCRTGMPRRRAASYWILGIAPGRLALAAQIFGLERSHAAEQLHEHVGVLQVGGDSTGEFGAAFRIFSDGHDPDLVILQVRRDPLALIVDVVGGLGEQHGYLRRPQSLTLGPCFGLCSPPMAVWHRFLAPMAPMATAATGTLRVGAACSARTGATGTCSRSRNSRSSSTRLCASCCRRSLYTRGTARTPE